MKLDGSGSTPGLVYGFGEMDFTCTDVNGKTVRVVLEKVGLSDTCDNTIIGGLSVIGETNRQVAVDKWLRYIFFGKQKVKLYNLNNLTFFQLTKSSNFAYTIISASNLKDPTMYRLYT